MEAGIMNLHARKVKIHVLALLALVCLLFASPNLTAAHGLSLQQNGPQVTVEVQEVDANFPNLVAFTLRLKGFKAKHATLNIRLVGRTTTSEVKADLDSPTNEISTNLDLSTHYMPPGAEIEYYWSLEDASGAAAETPKKTFKLLDERYSWQTLTDPGNRVSVHWYTVSWQEGGSKFGQSILDTATQALDRLQRDIGATLDRPANIWVYANQEDLASALFQNNPEWVGGQAFPDLALVVVDIADDVDAPDETRRMVPHELSHLVLYQATRNPYNSPPAWLDEGMAVHNQGVRYPDEEAALREAASDGRILPLKALSGSFGADEETTRLSYAQAGSVADFILSDSRYGPKKLARTIAAFQKGVTYDEALETGLGVTVDELDRQWRESLPYKVAAPAAPGSAPAATTRETQLTTLLRSPLVLVPLLLCGLLFVSGGILTVVMLARRGRAA
ncbi:MAG TPA: peptidase MA family metallohydrolase [Chloroflexia bacterium]|nr:peptidase MA family metallohydrolase [Chloroflexia bacterium]